MPQCCQKLCRLLTEPTPRQPCCSQDLSFCKISADCTAADCRCSCLKSCFTHCCEVALASRATCISPWNVCRYALLHRWNATAWTHVCTHRTCYKLENCRWCVNAYLHTKGPACRRYHMYIADVHHSSIGSNETQVFMHSTIRISSMLAGAQHLDSTSLRCTDASGRSIDASNTFKSKTAIWLSCPGTTFAMRALDHLQLENQHHSHASQLHQHFKQSHDCQ